jgi:hypothetical protein
MLGKEKQKGETRPRLKRLVRLDRAAAKANGHSYGATTL